MTDIPQPSSTPLKMGGASNNSTLREGLLSVRLLELLSFHLIP